MKKAKEIKEVKTGTVFSSLSDAETKICQVNVYVFCICVFFALSLLSGNF